MNGLIVSILLRDFPQVSYIAKIFKRKETIMLYVTAFACILLVCFSLFARYFSLMRAAVTFIVAAGLCCTLIGLLIPVKDWEIKYIYAHLGAFLLWFIAPFVVVYRRSLSVSIAWASAIGLVLFTSVAMWRVFVDVQKGFSLGYYLLLMLPALLVGGVIADFTHSNEA